MVRRFAQKRRRGAVAVESTVALPVLLFFILATLVSGYGVFRYQQISLLAREAARYASVHGGQYHLETGNAAATSQDVYNNAILPYAVNLDLSQLSYTVTWNTSNMPYSVGSDYVTPTNNTVTVTVNYNWFPEAYLIGPVVLTSTSTMPMSY